MAAANVKNVILFRSLHFVLSDGSFFVRAFDDNMKVVDSSGVEGDSELVTDLKVLCSNQTVGFGFPEMQTLLEGGLLETVGADKKVRVWDVDGGFCAHYFKGHKGVVTSVLFHPDPNRLIVSCLSKNTVTALILKPGDKVMCSNQTVGFGFPEMQTLLEGGLLATVGADKKVRVWDVDGGFCAHYFKGHKGVVTGVLFHPDPNRLIVVNIWNLHDYSCATTVPSYEALEAVCTIGRVSPPATRLSGSSGIGRWPQAHSLLSFEGTAHTRLIGTTIAVVRLSKSRLLIGVDSRASGMEAGYELLLSDSFRKYRVLRKNIFVFFAGLLGRRLKQSNRWIWSLHHGDGNATLKESWISWLAFSSCFHPNNLPITGLRFFVERKAEYKVYAVGDNEIPREVLDDVFGISSGFDKIQDSLTSLPRTVESVSSEMLRAFTLDPHTRVGR